MSGLRGVQFVSGIQVACPDRSTPCGVHRDGGLRRGASDDRAGEPADDNATSCIRRPDRRRSAAHGYVRAPPGTSEPERNDAATPTAPPTDTPQPPPTAAMTSEPSLEPEETAEKAEEPIATEPAATSPPTLEPTPTPEPEAPQNLAHLFTLPNALDENPVSLKSFRGQKSVVLIFYRGFW